MSLLSYFIYFKPTPNILMFKQWNVSSQKTHLDAFLFVQISILKHLVHFFPLRTIHDLSVTAPLDETAPLLFSINHTPSNFLPTDKKQFDQMMSKNEVWQVLNQEERKDHILILQPWEQETNLSVGEGCPIAGTNNCKQGAIVLQQESQFLLFTNMCRSLPEAAR